MREQLRRVAMIDEAVGQAEVQHRHGDALGREQLRRRALPAPPATTFSSTVTSASCSRASCATSSASSGLTKRMLATVASSSSAAASAGCSMLPNARIATRFGRRWRLAAHFALADRQRRHLAPRCATPGPAAARIAHGRRRVEHEAGVEHLPALVLVGRRHHRRCWAGSAGTTGRSADVRRAVGADDARAVDREHHRQVLQRDVVDQLVVGALQERRVDGDDGLHALRTRARRRTSPRAARRCRRRSSAPGYSCEKRTSPEPSRIAGVMPTMRGSRAAMSHSQSPNTCV